MYFGGFYYDPVLMVISIAAMIVSFVVSNKLKNKFKKYSQIPISNGMSGREVAERMLRDNGIYDVQVISVPGHLTDHYNPEKKTVNLSPDVYNGRNAAAAAVAAHECGHAVQHARAYGPLKLRSQLVPLQNVSAKVLNFLMIAFIFGGFFFMRGNFSIILPIFIGCYGVFTAFALITLPVEFDASKRALAWMGETGIVNRQEYDRSRDALKWAALTYVVAALGSLATFLYYLSMFMGRDD